MDWMQHNPIADMYGPTFLALYGGMIVLIIAEAIRSKGRHDRSDANDLPPVPTKPDPHAIAYLRGGDKELTRLLVFDLFRRGYLRPQDPESSKGSKTSSAKRKIEQAPDAPPESKLDPLERKVYRYFTDSRLPVEVFQTGGLSSKVKALCKPIEKSLQADQLLSPPERYSASARVGFTGGLLIVTLGFYKLTVALERGHSNVVFLLVMLILGVVVLIFSSSVPRLTRRGKAYLEQLQAAFLGLKDRTDQVVEKGPMADPAILLVPAIFGIGTLAGTSYGYVPELFAASTTAGGCGGGGCGGSGCGGGGCGGGGCGGGCGGCGS